jgi:hypothetical protein
MLINSLFEDNQLSDLKRFMRKRQCLNSCNFYLMYLFYLVQYSGILVTTVATGYNKQELIWVGVGLNILASLIHAYEQQNSNVSAKLLGDIQLIKSGKYVDEGIIVNNEEHTKGNNQKTISSDA